MSNRRLNSFPAASDPAVGALAINYSGGDQTFNYSGAGNPNQAVCRAIYISGGGGALKVDMWDGAVGITFSGLVAGQIYPIAVKKIYQTGSSATGLALF